MVPDRYVRAVRLQRQARPGQQPRVEDRGLRRRRQGGAAQRRHRLPLGPGRPRRRRPVEPGSQGSAPRRRGQAQALGAGGRCAQHRDRQGRLPLLRRHRQRALPEQHHEASSDVLVRTVPVQRISLGKAGEKREALVATVFDLQVANYGIARGLPGELAAEELRRRHPLHPGLAGDRSPACRASSSSPWRASSPTTPTRPRASPWSSSARR